MPKFTREQRFLYTRIAILIANVLWLAFAFAGFKGFPFWYGGFVFFFWIAFGLLNYTYKSSVWLIHKKVWLFLLLYLALVGTSYFVDRFGLNHHLWFYPFYRGAGMLWVWFVLYPFAGLAVLELLYFLGGYLGEPLTFRQHPMTKWHGFFDVFEQVLFLTVTGVIVLGALRLGVEIALPITTALVLIWLGVTLFKLHFHIRHLGHYSLVILSTVLLALLSHELPNTVAREWVYLEAPLSSFFNVMLLGLPVWVWLGWFWLVLLPLRLWIFLVLHPKVK
ncbi:MAG: hypothetical protein EXS51_01370 [Candidatus Taylorbacteria bacterium]|nr:hypothetical protein [Candidatus Taylorbacteria bacterium]